MNKTRIKVTNLPTQPPLLGTLVWWLVLDKLDAAGWVWGVLGTLLVVFWIAFFVSIFTSEYRDVVFKEKTDVRKD